VSNKQSRIIYENDNSEIAEKLSQLGYFVYFCSMFFSKLLYQAAIQGYKIVLRIAALKNDKAKKMLEGRKNWQQNFEGWSPDKHKVAWFHCASLGEFEQGRPVLEAFKTQYPDWKILLTFFSSSGFEIRKNYSEVDMVTYLPFDSAKNSREFLRLANPAIIFFVKYEFWFFYIEEAAKRNIPLFSISAIFRENQAFFKSWGSLHRQMLSRFKHIFVQNEASAKLLAGIGIKQHSIAGDTRFDRVWTIKNSIKSIRTIELFKGTQRLIVAGSVWPQDRELLKPLIESDKVNYKWLIVPHDIDEMDIKEWQKILPKNTSLYSSSKLNPESKVLLIDRIGLLSSLYAYADVAYIGGAFGKGLHNTLEAAVFGIPIFFGNKNYSKFHEALALCNLGAATALSNSKEMMDLLSDDKQNTKLLNEKGLICIEFVKSNLGASEYILSRVEKWVKEKV
jgi:3-deoxy-D-manno-octulosonic-acid transferase